MKFSIDKTIEILERTPGILDNLLRGLSGDWTMFNEGPGTWSPYDIVGHLIHGEKTDWIPRINIILSASPDKEFTPFDRFAQFTDSKGKTIGQLLDEFQTLREKNIEWLHSAKLSEEDLMKTGIHPEFGVVSLKELLATWVAHDLNHISQATRVMAKQYKSEAGPWVAYLKILQ